MANVEPNLIKTISRCIQADWWAPEPKPDYVPDGLVAKTPGVRLLGLSIDPTVRDSQPLNDEFNRLLSESSKLVRDIEYIAIKDADLTGSANNWLTKLRRIRYIDFHRCQLNARTLSSFQVADEIRTIILRNCVVDDAAAIAGLPNVRVIQLIDTDVRKEQLHETRRHLPDTLLQAFLTEGRDHVPILTPAEPIHDSDTELLKRIRDAMRRMSARMTAIGVPPVASKEWKAADTTKVEEAIGYRLPSDLRFALSLNTGQFDRAVCQAPFQRARDMISETREQQSFHWGVPEFFNLRDATGRWHYPLVTFMGEDATDICLDLVTGEVVWRHAADGEVMAPNLAEFFERLAAKMQTCGIEETRFGKSLEIYTHDLTTKDSIGFGKFRSLARFDK